MKFFSTSFLSCPGGGGGGEGVFLVYRKHPSCSGGQQVSLNEQSCALVCRHCEILEDSVDFSESLKEKVDTGWGLKAVRERACLSLPSLLPLMIEAS